MELNTTNDTFDASSVARSAGFALFMRGGSWGSATLHPRLYAVAALRGLRTNPTHDQLDQSFLKHVGLDVQFLALTRNHADPICPLTVLKACDKSVLQWCELQLRLRGQRHEVKTQRRLIGNLHLRRRQSNDEPLR